MKRKIKITLAVVYVLLAFLILIGETQVFLSKEMSLLGWILKLKDLENIRIVSFLTIIFISYMVYYSLFRLKLSNLYGLYRK